MLKNHVLAAALLCVASGSAAAREVALDVPGLLERIATENAEVRSARSGYTAAREGISVAKAARLPKISASLDLMYLGDGTVLDRDFSNAMRDKLPHFGNTLNVNLYQPIFQGGAISGAIDLARQQADLAEIGVTQAADASSIQALSAFFRLMQMKNLRAVYEENIAITERLIAQMREHFNQGTALRNDITRYELRLSSLRFDLQSVDNSISVLNEDLRTMLGYDPDVDILPAADLDPAAHDLRSEEYWQALTASRSTDLKALDKSAEMTRTGIKLERAATLPSLGVVIGDNLSGPVTFEIPALDKNYNAWYAGVSISYDFSSLYTANKKMRRKRLELNHIADQRQALSDALGRKVHEAYTSAVQARQQLDTETVNVRLANENYAVVETRFQNDMALLTDMLDASSAKLDAETRLVNARVAVLLSFYNLRYLSGTLTNH